MVGMATHMLILAVFGSSVLSSNAQTTEKYNEPVVYGTECLPPPDLRNGIWMGKTNPKTVLFYCHHGYKLEGPEKKVCLSNGTWDPADIPFCVDKPVDNPEFVKQTCQKPSIVHGNIEYAYNSEFNPGDSVLVHCNNLYAVKLDNTLVKMLKLLCSQDGKWVTRDGWHVDPECSVSLCASPPDVPHSHISLIGTAENNEVVEGQEVIYTCKTGYTLVDSTANRLVCRNGEWRGNMPTCISLERCMAPEEIRHGSFFIPIGDVNILETFQYKLSTIVTYKCDAGYKLIGPSSIECLQGSRWSHHAPQCVSVQESTKYCESVTAVHNGRCFCESKSDLMFCEPFFEGMHVECVCNEGYKLIGQSIVTCGSDGKWDYIMPSCIQDMEIHDNKASGSSGNQSHMSTLAIVIATACSVLGVLLLIMVIMVFRRRKPHPPRLCRPSSVPPPYSRVHSNSMDEHDRMLLIGYDNTQVALPSYEEAVRGPNQRGPRSGQGQVGDYRPLPSIPTNFRGGQLQSGDASSRHSIITTSTMNRDGISELFGSIDTVNVSMSDASTAVTVETCDSSSSHHSSVSRRATAGSINSSNGSLVTEDVPLLENNQRNNEINTIDNDEDVEDKPDN